MKRWKLYFAYEHLPPHLQTVSKPFYDLIDLIISEGDAVKHISPRDFRAAESAVSSALLIDSDEADWAFKKMSDAFSMLRRLGAPGASLAIRLLLEAKDCAVRAHLPDPPEPDAKAAP